MSTEIKHELENNIITEVLTTALTGFIITGYRQEDNTIAIAAHRSTTLALATYLKLSTLFTANNPLDCHVIDRIEDKFRFTIVYNIQSIYSNTRIHLITKTSDTLPLQSLQSIYPAFNWSEREAWDMSGLFFVKHPDLRRILTDYGFAGHPLRKDFPLSGFRELHYEDSTKHVEYDTVELSQNYRVLTITSHWSHAKA